MDGSPKNRADAREDLVNGAGALPLKTPAEVEEQRKMSQQLLAELAAAQDEAARLAAVDHFRRYVELKAISRGARMAAAFLGYRVREDLIDRDQDAVLATEETP